MPSGNFIDYVKIYCRSGKGGAGCMHLHRAKYVPKGGPDGGDGGRGGHIILQGNRNLWTLLHLKYQKHIMATDGGRGGESRSFGKDGEDKTHLICYMPAEGKWKEIAGQGIEGEVIANFHNRLISIGGYNPKYAGKVRLIDVSTDPAQTSEFMDLDTGFVLVQTAVAGNTLYLYGGFASDLQQLRFSKDNKKVFCYTVNGQESFRDREKETEVYESTASDFSGYNSVICASDRDVYLVGAYMKEGISGSVTDPSGFRISEGDTWVLTNPMQNLGKRLSHTIVRDPCATVYKGVLYGLGTNKQDGDPLK